MAVYTPEIECASRDYLHAVQSARLLKMVRTAYENVPFYKKKFDEMGLLPGDIHSIDDIGKLPFTLKTDLRDNYPFGLFAVPQSELVRIHASSGTTGKRRWSATPPTTSTSGPRARPRADRRGLYAG